MIQSDSPCTSKTVWTFTFEVYKNSSISGERGRSEEWKEANNFHLHFPRVHSPTSYTVHCVPLEDVALGQSVQRGEKETSIRQGRLDTLSGSVGHETKSKVRSRVLM
jgi:hypothetical protein